MHRCATSVISVKGVMCSEGKTPNHTTSALHDRRRNLLQEVESRTWAVMHLRRVAMVIFGNKERGVEKCERLCLNMSEIQRADSSHTMKG